MSRNEISETADNKALLIEIKDSAWNNSEWKGSWLHIKANIYMVE